MADIGIKRVKVKKSTGIKRTRGEKIGDFIIYVVLMVFVMIALVPIVYITIMSFANTNGFVPENFALDAYKYIFSTPTFLRSISMTAIITVGGTLISVILTVLMAYSLSEKGLKGRRIFLFMVTITMIFSGGMIPTFFVVRGTGLYNTLWAVMIPNAVTAFNLILVKNFFVELPAELKESARMDGCHELRLVWQIMIPLSTPIIATVSLFYAVSRWNTFTEALLYINKSELWPVQVLLRRIIFQLTGGLGDATGDAYAMSFSGESMKSAVIVVSSLPILVIYPFLQKYFTKGLLMGSVKG